MLLAVTDMRLILIVPTFSTWLAPELSLLAIEYVHAASPWLPTQVAGGVVARSDRPPEPPVLAIERADGYR